ncbi:MAG: transposase [Bacteroidota bacterium]|nr:transposase [Bacteroidota bacterium]
MSEGYQIYDQNALYYLTFQIVDWVDIFTRETHKEIIVKSLDFCKKSKGLEIYGYVIMTNHIHIIARSKEGNRLSDTIRDLKKITANQLLEQIKLPTESRSEWLIKRFEFAAKKHK